AASAAPASTELRECRTIAKPSRESRRAMAAPMPEVEPVTSATGEEVFMGQGLPVRRNAPIVGDSSARRRVFGERGALPLARRHRILRPIRFNGAIDDLAHCWTGT